MARDVAREYEAIESGLRLCCSLTEDITASITSCGSQSCNACAQMREAVSSNATEPESASVCSHYTQAWITSCGGKLCSPLHVMRTFFCDLIVAYQRDLSISLFWCTLLASKHVSTCRLYTPASFRTDSDSACSNHISCCPPKVTLPRRHSQ